MILKLFSTYTGYGGAEWSLFLENIKYELIGFSEIKPSVKKLYLHNFPEHQDKDFGDLKNTPLYEAAGNGWDVNFVRKLLKNWLKNGIK